MTVRNRAAGTLVCMATAFFGMSLAEAQEPIRIGQISALSGPSAQSGEAIARGLTIAIEEINDAGGPHGGGKLELVQRDDQSNTPRGLTAARELIFNADIGRAKPETP